MEPTRMILGEVDELDTLVRPERRSALRSAAGVLHHLPGPMGGGIAAAFLSGAAGTPVEGGMVAFFSLLLGGALTNRKPEWARLLPMMGALARSAGPLLGVSILALIDAVTGLPGLSDAGLLGIALIAVAAAVAGEAAAIRLSGPSSRVRVAVIGYGRTADSLHRELIASGNQDYVVVGRIRPPGDDYPTLGEVPTLGALEDLGAVVAEHEIRLLLMTGDVPRLAVFGEIAESCLHLPVRLQELTGFYEEVFGHVPVAEINASWFQYIMHPAYRAAAPVAKRALDLVVSLAAAIIFLPILAILVVLIKRDGGPVLFKQVRIGEGGRPFTIYKLRTMREGVSGAWAQADDDRITGVGRVLRKTHLDEVPQLFNVLRGEMSIVGPRPEQPAFVQRLETVVPFYSRRHLIKPGVTGWAQVRCGYAGSDVGSAWKVSHDLYYLKHRTFWLDVVVLGETLRTLLADRQYTVQPDGVGFILRSEHSPIGAAPAERTPV